MASSGTINNTFRTGYAVRITWTVTGQSVANNTSTLTANVQLVSLGSSYTINSSATKSGTLTVNGTTYSFTFSAALTGNQTKTIYTKTGIVVPHNADGSKTCAFSCAAGIAVTLGGTYYSSVSASGAGMLDTIARASTISSITGSVTINGTNAVTINIARASSSFLHHVLIQYGAYSQAFQMVVPESVKPTISSIGITEASPGIAEKFGAYVQGKTKFNVAIIAAQAYSSAITSIKTTVEGNTYSGSNITTGIINTSGSVGFAFSVTDGRGRTTGDSRTRDVLPYTSPTITTFKCQRSNANGTANDEGTYLKATINFAISPVNNKNDKKYTLKYKKQTDTAWTTLTTGSAYTYNSNYVSTTAVLNTDAAYNIMLEISDYFGTVTRTADIGTAYTLVDFNASGYGIAFGKVSQKNAFECKMEMYDKTDVAVRNGLAYYGGGHIDPDTTTEHLLLTDSKTPSGGGFYYIMTVFYSSRTGNRSQIAIPYNQATGVYFRTYFNGTWSAWQRS